MKALREFIALVLIISIFTVVTAKAVDSYLFYKHGKSVIELLAPNNSGGGTGFELKFKGKQYTMTNGHVCELGEQEGYLVLISPYAHIRKLHILANSPDTDLCLLEPVTELPALELGDRDFVKHDYVSVLGHPLLGPLHESKGFIETHLHWIDVMSYFIVTRAQHDACLKPKNRIEHMFFGIVEVCLIHVQSQLTSALIEPGNSGSPVLDWEGYVRGVAFAANLQDKQAEIIPFSHILKFLQAQ